MGSRVPAAHPHPEIPKLPPPPGLDKSSISITDLLPKSFVLSVPNSLEHYGTSTMVIWLCYYLFLCQLYFSDGSCKFSHAVTNKPQEIQPGQEFDTSTLGHGVLCCFSNSGKLFALCTPQKELLIWHTNDWKLLSKR